MQQRVQEEARIVSRPVTISRSVTICASVVLLAALLLAVFSLAARSSPADAQIEVEPLRIAVIGDSGIRAESRAVLQLIKDEGADLVIHTGDFDYNDNPAGFESTINNILGPDFPFFAVVGNHDVPEWPTYKQNFVDRLNNVPEANCTGNYGVKASCTFRGLSFLLSGVGTLGSGHEAYLANQLEANEHIWRLCVFHKNQHEMQVGEKTSDVGWQAYETCGENGAIVLTGHEHSYSRTKTLTDMENQTIDPLWPLADSVRTGPGSSFVVVSGLGGKPIRPQLRCLPATPPYGCQGEWASISSSSNGGDYGALFLDLGVDGDPRKGRGTFINISGNTVDSFEIRSDNVADSVTPTPTPTPVVPGDFVLVDEGSTWSWRRFSQPGWRDLSFDDSNWPADVAKLGFGDGDVISDVRAGKLAYYFRQEFVASGPQTSLDLSLVRDDGAVVYVNGVEVARSNMPDGPITSSTLASSRIGGAGEKQWNDFVIDGSMLVAGTNVVAVEVHQNVATSLDLAFDLKLSGDGPAPAQTTYFSVKNATEVAGVTFPNEDIIEHDAEGLNRYFDGSDVGLGPSKIDAFTFLDDGDIVMSFSNISSVVPGIAGMVDDSDLVRFSPTSLGRTTSGTFSMYFDGSDVGLTTQGEDIDAVAVLPDGSLILSTIGVTSMGGITPADEDLFRFDPSSLGTTTSGTFSMYFDGSDVGVRVEDLDAVSVNGTTLSMSFQGEFTAGALSGSNEDIVDFEPTQTGTTTTGSFLSPLRYDGSDTGLSVTDIGGIHVP